MDIHKPKPMHSWRDFLKELGTIVLGIVIAISLEQMVEAWHWDGEVKLARQAIAAEMAANGSNMFAFRVAAASCMNQQLDEADAILSALEAGHKPGQFSNFHRIPPSSLLRDSEWQSERASQVLTHFPRDELSLMGRYYGQLEDFRSWGKDETSA